MAENNIKNIEHAELTPDLIKAIIDNQAKEIELRAIELSLQKQQDANSFEFGKAALTAKTEDRKLQRQHELSVRKWTYGILAFFVVVISGIVIYAIHTGSKDIALEIIKAVVYILGGGLGGYGVAKSGNNSKDSEQSDK